MEVARKGASTSLTEFPKNLLTKPKILRNFQDWKNLKKSERNSVRILKTKSQNSKIG